MFGLPSGPHAVGEEAEQHAFLLVAGEGGKEVPQNFQQLGLEGLFIVRRVVPQAIGYLVQELIARGIRQSGRRLRCLLQPPGKDPRWVREFASKGPVALACQGFLNTLLPAGLKQCPDRLIIIRCERETALGSHLKTGFCVDEA